jgi:protein SCO1/2
VRSHDTPAPQRANRVLDGWPIEPFTLVDQHGRKVTRDTLLGQWTFVLLGDSRCAEPCTGALTALTGLSKRIEQSDAILNTRVLFVSVDPERDTQARLKGFIARYDKHFVAATGTHKTLAQLSDDLGSKPSAGALVLVGPDGALRAEYLPPFDVKRLTADYLKTRLRR